MAGPRVRTRGLLVAAAALAVGAAPGCHRSGGSTLPPGPGALVTSFAGGGVAVSDPSVRDDVARGATLYGTKLIVVGDDQAPGAGDRRWHLEKWCF